MIAPTAQGASGRDPHPYPVALRDEVEDYLGQLRFADEPACAGLAEAMRYSLLAGGKRIRPVLTLATARVLGIDHRGVLPLAAALELVHTFSLIHDDLPAMDDDDYRRGKPTNHQVYGDGVAVLAGDALLAEAFRLLLALDAPADRVVRASRVVADAIATDGLAGGQYIDLARTAQTEAAVLDMHRRKTGRLLEASVLAVLALTDATPQQTDALTRYGQELGLLFQIVDDVLDVIGASTDTGRLAGSDVRNGRRTVVVDGRLDRATRLADASFDRVISALEALPSDCGELLAIAQLVRGRIA